MDSVQPSTTESSEKACLGVASALVSAVHEWLLIVMLFINAWFSYLVTRFARRFQLQIPCLLCSRLDHVLGKEKPGFVWDLMCHQHRLNISSLVLCQIHKNLVDVHGMCESCIFSFATIDKSNTETFRLLPFKLRDEPHHGLAQGNLPADSNLGSWETRKCCCCSQLWSSRTPAQKLLHTTSSDSGINEFDSPIIPTSKRGNDDEWQEIAEENNIANQLSHIGYEKVKVTSDSESEAQISDDETVGTHKREIATSEQDSSLEHAVQEPQESMHSILLRNFSFPGQDDAPSSCCKDESEEPLGHGLEGLNWQQTDNKNDFTKPSDLISFTEPCPSSTLVGDSFDELKESTNSSELVKEVVVECRDASKMQNESSVGTESWEEGVQSGETTRVRSNSIAGSENQSDLKPYANDTSSQTADSLDLGDAYRLALGTRGRQLSGKLLEQQMSMQESKRASEDLKVLLSQLSAVRGMELSLNDNSPRMRASSDDFASMDAVSLVVSQSFQRRISLERNESTLSVDGSPVGEIEGESTVDRLTRQAEHDKKIMTTLYKELEEERNASADAVNQAMAMITRLQEEKAAIHMEALQYLRMMEEQAEYDGEAFQEVNDLLVEKEKQIQRLEAELELSKNTSKDVDVVASHAGEPEEHPADKNKHDTRKMFMLQFENEKNCTLKSLKKLEKLFEFSRNEANPDMDSACEELDDSTHSSEAYINKRVPDRSELDALRHEISFISNRLEAILGIEPCILESSINSEQNGEGL